MRIDSDDFELFGLPRQFEQDIAAIDARWRTLLAECHPDRFVSEGEQAQRLAMQWSVRINEAHRRLKDPLARAAYLCELHGAPIHAEDNTAMPGSFLMQQMEWREALGDARAAKDADALDALDKDVRMERTALLAQVGKQLDAGEYDAAAQGVRSLMFLDKFGEEVQYAYEAIEG